MIIKTPIPEWSGYVRNIYFSRGVAETTDERAIAWFKSNGYIVEEPPTLVEKAIEVKPNDKKRTEKLITPPTIAVTPLPDLSRFSVDELREFMMRSGVSPGNIRSKARLLQKIYENWSDDNEHLR